MDKDTKVTLEQIRADIKGDRNAIKSLGADDENLISSANKEVDDTEYKVRNVLYSNILYAYIEEHKSKNDAKKCYKFVFFAITMITFLALIIAPIIIIFIVTTKASDSGIDIVSSIAAIIGSTTGIVSAVVVLPKIIAEHLFPTNEETHLIELIKNMQSNDSNTREASKLDK